MSQKFFTSTLSVVLSFALFIAGAPSWGASAKSCSALLGRVSTPAVSIDPQALKIFEGIYDHATALKLAESFSEVKSEALAKRPHELILSDIKSIQNPDRLLDEVQYMGYVEGIGSEGGRGTFRNLNKMVDYLTEQLGISMVYVLPFLKSPFKDAGFDVADYKSVDPRFGGNREFNLFKDKLSKKDGRLQMDLVLNHTSADHIWAKKALAGDPQYRAYYHILETPPDVVKVTHDSKGLPIAAAYREKGADGREVLVERRVIFPDFADPAHPHYTRLVDGHGKTIWVYHTFYPFQFDLNYKNPQIIREALGIVAHWANEGVDVIRLDAIPFLFKNQESDPRTLKFVESLRYFLSQVSPRTSLIVEACQEPSIVYKFFGQQQNIRVEHLKQNMMTTSSAQLAYNFDLMGFSWASLLSGNKKYLIESLQKTLEPPRGTVWANFLRLHDELTLEMVPDHVRKIIQDALLSTGKGTSFRGGFGVGGRMADFLDRDPVRIKMAFSLLLSLRGMPIIYYGDEIMAPSNKAYAKKAAADRGGQYDARDEGRGPVEKSAYQQAVWSNGSTPEGVVFKDVQRLIQVRKQRVSLRRGNLEIMETSHPSAVAYTRSLANGETTLIVHNLSGKELTTTVSVKKVPKKLFDLLNERRIDFKISGDKLLLTLDRFESLWLAM